MARAKRLPQPTEMTWDWIGKNLSLALQIVESHPLPVGPEFNKRDSVWMVIAQGIYTVTRSRTSWAWHDTLPYRNDDIGGGDGVHLSLFDDNGFRCDVIAMSDDWPMIEVGFSDQEDRPVIDWDGRVSNMLSIPFDVSWDEHTSSYEYVTGMGRRARRDG